MSGLGERVIPETVSAEKTSKVMARASQDEPEWLARQKFRSRSTIGKQSQLLGERTGTHIPERGV